MKTSSSSRRPTLMAVLSLPILLGIMIAAAHPSGSWLVSAFSLRSTLYTSGRWKSYRYPNIPTTINRCNAPIINSERPSALMRSRRKIQRRPVTELFAVKNDEGLTASTVRATKTKKNGGGKPKAKAKKKKAPKSIDVEVDDVAPLYWRVETDEFVFLDGGANATNGHTEIMDAKSSNKDRDRKVLKFTVRGKPVPLRRHRTSRGFMYNPSANLQLAFREVVSDMIYSESEGTSDLASMSEVEQQQDGNVDDVESSSMPIFKEDEYLAVTLLFRLRRPKSHFVGGRPGPGRLRPTSPGRLHTTRTDVDNLAKFVLDSLNDLVYADDRQVISLHAAKVMDSEGHCEGATEVTICRLEESKMESFVANMAG